MDYPYTLLKFVAGGSVIIGMTLLAEHVAPRYGGMLAAAPIITTIAFLFTYSDAGKKTTRQLVISAFWFAIPAILFLLTLYFLMNRYGVLPSFWGRLGSGAGRSSSPYTALSWERDGKIAGTVSSRPDQTT